MSSRRRKRDRPDAGALQAFVVECPACRKHAAVARSLVGRVARCPSCAATFLVPTPEPAEATPPAPSADRPRRRRQPESPGPAVEPAPVARAPEPPPAAARPDPSVAFVDEPLVFSQPPPPSTRRTPDEPHLAATAPEVTANTLPFDTAGDDAPTSSPLGQSAAASTQPTTDSTAASSAGLAFHDPVKTIRIGGAEIELRRLTPEEKRVRRARRNVLILLVGAALLVALAVILGGGRR